MAAPRQGVADRKGFAVQPLSTGRRASVDSPRAARGSGGSPRMSGSPKASPTGASSPKKGSSENVRVLVRVRPFSQKEIDIVKSTRGAHMQSVIDMPRSDQVQVLDHEKGYTAKSAYNFDTVFWSVTEDQQQSPIGFADQQQVFEETGLIALESAWEGINSCIFAYGQTGSGKTHTMMGDPAQIAEEQGCGDDQLGVIPRLCRQLFVEAEDKRDQNECTGINKSIEVETVFIEIYNESVHDLLTNPPEHIEHFTRSRSQVAAIGSPENRRGSVSPVHRSTTRADASPHRSTTRADDLMERSGSGAGLKRQHSGGLGGGLKIREHPTEGPQVTGVTVCKPTSYKDVMDIINWGNQQRHVASTKMNDRSSRSHAMFRICLRQLTRLEQERAGIGGPKVQTSERRANLNLVDLAGSENTKRSGAQGSTMLEAQKINLSLTTLRRVIDALIEGKQKSLIPYRDSTLTWLLSQDLGGNSKCFMLATVSPHMSNAHESQNTLVYASRARSITNMVRANEDDTAKMFSDLEKRLWENQKRLLSEQATQQEKEGLERQKGELEGAQQSLQRRIDSMHVKAGKAQQDADTGRKLRVHQRYKHVAALAVQKHRIDQAQQVASEQNTELDKIRQQAGLAGYDDVDDLAASMQTNKQKIKGLSQEKDALEQSWKTRREHNEELKRLREEEISDLRNRVVLLKEQKSDEGTSRGQGLDAQRSVNEKLKAQTRDMYTEQIQSSKERHADKMRLIQEEHQQHVHQCEMTDEETLSSALTELNSQLDDAKKDSRVARESHSKKLRDVQTAEMDLRTALQTAALDIKSLQNELKLSKQTQHDELPEIERKLRQEEEQSEARSCKLREIEDEARVEKDRVLLELQRLRETVARSEAESMQSQGELNDVCDEFRTKEAMWGKASARPTDFLRFLSSLTAVDGDIPSDWSSQRASDVIIQYSMYRCSLKSVKPGTGTVSTVKAEERLLPGPQPRLSWAGAGQGEPEPEARPPAPDGPAAVARRPSATRHSRRGRGNSSRGNSPMKQRPSTPGDGTVERRTKSTSKRQSARHAAADVAANGVSSRRSSPPPDARYVAKERPSLSRQTGAPRSRRRYSPLPDRSRNNAQDA